VQKNHTVPRYVCGGSAYGRAMFPMAALPNPSEPGFVAFGAVMGAFVGEIIARRLRYDDDKRMRIVVDGVTTERVSHCFSMLLRTLGRWCRDENSLSVAFSRIPACIGRGIDLDVLRSILERRSDGMGNHGDPRWRDGDRRLRFEAQA
jgi:hypothetical protein